MTNASTFGSSQNSGLLNWARKLRAREGSLSPKYYTGIVRKAKTKQEVLDVVSDFEEQIGKVDDIFLAAAHTAANIDSCPPSVAANLLSQIPKDMAVFEGVSISVLNKAASAQDIKSARMAFDVLKNTDPESAWSGLLRAHSHDHSSGCRLVEQMIVEIECNSQFAVQTLGGMLKCAGNVNRFDVVERV